MEKIKTKFKGLFLIKTKNNYDNRGFFREIYIKKNFNKNFIFDYYSLSKKNTVKGLHFQMNKPQDKLIILLKGRIIDYCLDLRKNSKTFLNLFKIKLSAKKGDALFVPAVKNIKSLILFNSSKLFFSTIFLIMLSISSYILS